VTSAVSVTFIGPILELTGYQPNVLEQSQEAVRGIKLVIGPIPAVLLGLGIFLAYRYPLDREDFANIIGVLNERRKSKGEEAKSI
jgi:GPH family glycoside/pentoside/hexuronide:cation symporter